jgi:hypothetical protein
MNHQHDEYSGRAIWRPGEGLNIAIGEGGTTSSPNPNEADVLNAVASHLGKRTHGHSLPTIMFANEPSKIRIEDPPNGSQGDGPTTNCKIYGTTPDEVHDAIACINMTTTVAETRNGDDRGPKPGALWGYQPNPGLMTNIISNCPHGTCFVAFYLVRNDNMIDRPTTLQTALAKVGPSNHAYIRCIEQGPTVIGKHSRGNTQVISRVLTVWLSFATAPDHVGYESLPPIEVIHDNCLNSITIKGTKTLLREHDEVLAQLRRIPNAILEPADSAPWDRTTHDARRLSVLTSDSSLGDSPEWMHQMWDSHVYEEHESLAIFLHQALDYGKQRIFLIQHTSIQENLERILAMASRLRIQTIPGRGNGLMVKTEPDRWETFRSRLLQEGITLPANFAQGTRAFELASSSKRACAYKMHAPGAYAGVSLQIYIANQAMLLQDAQELYQYVLGEAQIDEAPGPFEIRVVNHFNKGEINVIAFESPPRLLPSITKLVGGNTLQWKGFHVEVQFLMGSTTSLHWKRLSQSYKETRNEHHENYSSREPDTKRRIVLNLWTSPDPYAQAVLGQMQEDSKWIRSGSQSVCIRGFSLQKEGTKLSFADVGSKDIKAFLSSQGKKWIDAGLPNLVSKSMQETVDFLGSHPTNVVIYLTGKTSLPIKIGQGGNQENKIKPGLNGGKASGIMIKAFSGLFISGTFDSCLTQIIWSAMEGEEDQCVSIWKEPPLQGASKNKVTDDAITIQPKRIKVTRQPKNGLNQRVEFFEEVSKAAAKVPVNLGKPSGGYTKPPYQGPRPEQDAIPDVGQVATDKPTNLVTGLTAHNGDILRRLGAHISSQGTKQPGGAVSDDDMGGADTAAVTNEDPSISGTDGQDSAGPTNNQEREIEEISESISENEPMGQTPRPRTQPNRRGKPVPNRIRKARTRSRSCVPPPTPPCRTPQEQVGEQKAGTNACHLAAALRILAHSDWTPGLKFTQSAHVVLRHVAKGGLQTDQAIDGAMHRCLRHFYPTEPFEQQDARGTLMRVLGELPEATQKAFRSNVWREEVCVANSCTQADANAGNSAASFTHEGNPSTEPLQVLQGVLDLFPANFVETDRECTTCGKRQIKAVNCFTELRATAVIAYATINPVEVHPTFVGQSGTLHGLKKTVVCTAELRYIRSPGTEGASGHYIVVEHRNNSNPFIYDPLGNRRDIEGEVVALVLRTQEHIESNEEWECGLPTPALCNDHAPCRPLPTPIRAPDSSRLQTLRTQHAKAGATALAPQRRFDKARKYAVISLFDGSGSTAHTVVDDMLDGLQPTAILSAENDPRIRPFVQEHIGFNPGSEAWQVTKLAKTGRYITDVWDIVRNKALVLREFLAQIGEDDPVILVAGSPCQDLTLYGPSKGILGVCGETSRHFNVIPVIIAIIQALQPSRFVFVTTENAGSMLAHHLLYMLKALGLGEEVVKHINAKDWTDVTRKRIFLSNCIGFILPQVQPSPWEPGWQVGLLCTTDSLGRKCYRKTTIMPLLRARGRNANDDPVHSTGAYHPSNLLYCPARLGGEQAFQQLWPPGENVPTIPWGQYFTLTETKEAWQTLLAWPIKNRIKPNKAEDEAAAILATAFAVGNLPFRPPNAKERMQQAEISKLFDTLEVTRPLLTEGVRTDIVGNAFLPSALTAAMKGNKEGGLANTIFHPPGQADTRIACKALLPDELKQLFRTQAAGVRADLVLEKTARDIGGEGVGKAMKQLHTTGFPPDVYSEISNKWLEVVKKEAETTAKPSIKAARPFDVIDIPFIQRNSAGGNAPPNPPADAGTMLSDPEVKTWNSVAPIFVQSLQKVVPTKIEPGDLLVMLPTCDHMAGPGDDIPSQPTGDLFTADQTFTYWAEATKRNAALSSVVYLPEFPARGQNGQGHLSNIRIYGTGGGDVYVVRFIQGALVIGRIPGQVLMGSPLYAAICEIDCKFVLYKHSKHETFGDLRPELRELVICGIRQDAASQQVHVLHNDLKKNGTTCNAAKGPSNQFIMFLLLGHQYVDGETFVALPLLIQDIPRFSSPSRIGDQAWCAMDKKIDPRMYGPYAPTGIIVSTTDRLPCSDQSLTLSRLPPRPSSLSPLSPSSPSILLVLTSVSASLTFLLIPIQYIPTFCQDSQRLQLFLQERGAEREPQQ